MSARTLALFLPLLLTACVGPSSEEFAKADFGPFPAAHQTKIKQFFNVNEAAYAGYIKPDWRFEQPFKAAFKESNSDAWRYGYGVEMRFNHKREFQGYAPNERHVFFFSGPDMWPVNAGDALKRAE